VIDSSPRFEAQVSSLVGDVDQRTSVVELRTRIGSAAEHPRRRLLQVLVETLRSLPVLANEASRVLLAKLIVAAVPESTSVLRHVLHELPDDDLVWELRFSLFVALSELPEVLGESELSELAREIDEFLQHVPRDAAQSAWMAGDLLGDHWPLRQSVPLLIRLARMARHSAGREAAIHGLSHALDRASKPQQWQIVDALKEVARLDGDLNIREYARGVLGELRGL
jgi:hypothetical protein